MADISQVKLPDGTTYNLKDSYVRTNYRALNNNDFDTINVTELNAGDLIVTGAARFLNTINGSISGNAVTATKATQDESGNNIKASYASSISISDHTITLKNKNGVSLGTVTVPDNATDNTKMPLAGGTFTGRVVYNNVSMPLAAGKVTGLTAGTTEIFKDAIAFSNPATSNDVGWIRVLGTGESDTVMEIATGDDGGAGEQIVVRQYNTSSTVVNEATLLDKSGNTTFPKNVTATKFIGALQGNADTATTATNLSGFTSTTTSGTAIDSATQNGHVYVTGTSGIYSQNDGACFVQAYSTSWVAQIYQDYRTGQIALRGKNNGTWQAWRKVWDSVNLTSKTAAASGTDLSLVTTGEKATWNAKASQDTKNTAGSTDTSSKIFLIGATSQAANPQTYSDDQVYVTSGTLQANSISATTNVTGLSLGVSSTTGTTGGISLYGGTTYVTKYGIAFRGTSNQGKHGYVQSDWATYFTMDGADTRGWVFKNAASGKGNVASISSAGHMVLNGSLTLGGNTTNTSGVRQVYNSTTKSLDFVFVA